MSSDPLSHLVIDADGDIPVIARVYEVESAEELRRQDAFDEQPEAPAAPQPEEARARAAEVEAPAVPGCEPLEEGGLPFIGKVLSFEPNQSIVVQRTLDLAEDLYLADHAFVHATGVKPLSACMPVLPLTMSLEAIAEVAACLTPGLGLIGFENVKAVRWIEVSDRDSEVMNICAQLQEIDVERHVWRIGVEVRLAGQEMPTTTATVLFSTVYRADLDFAFGGFSNAYRGEKTGEDIYRERHMFHGPRFHCLTGEILIADEGAVAQLLTKPQDDLFRSLRQPQLLLDPALLDGVGQLIGIWAGEQDRYVLPIGFAKLEIYGATPPPGTLVPIRIEITRDEALTLYADVEVQDGAGGVWMRIKDWGSFKFRYPSQALDFRRHPTRYLLSRGLELPGLPAGAVSHLVSKADVNGFDAMLLARHVLHFDEMPLFVEKGEVPQRQFQWLLGRVAAKDSIRAWLAARSGTDGMLHPAALLVANEESGQPVSVPPEGQTAVPRISLSHCEDRAVAIASEQPVGIDIEIVRPREPGFVDSLCTNGERELLSAVCGEDDEAWSEWLSRLWSAKEAAGKLLGQGLNGSPHRIEAITLNGSGNFIVQIQESDRLIGVNSVRDGDFVIAYTTGQRTGMFG